MDRISIAREVHLIRRAGLTYCGETYPARWRSTLRQADCTACLTALADVLREEPPLREAAMRELHQRPGGFWGGEDAIRQKMLEIKARGGPLPVAPADTGPQEDLPW